jgi:hypothetical protein
MCDKKSVLGNRKGRLDHVWFEGVGESTDVLLLVAHGAEVAGRLENCFWL